MTTTATPQDINRYADTVMTAIDEDIEDRAGACNRHGPIPADIATFSDLQSYVDANCYLLDAVPFDNAPECTCPVNRGLQTYHSPACQTQTDAYRAAWDAYMEVCNEVSSEVDRRLRARTTCPACGGQLESTGPFDGRAPSSGVTAGHEGFGQTFTCWDTAGEAHWFTLIQGALVPPARILTVVEAS